MSQPINQALIGGLRRMGLDRQLPEKLALFFWDELAQAELPGKTFPQKVQKGILIVGVSSPVLRSDLNMKKSLYLEKLNRLLAEKGGSAVKDIKFTYAQPDDFPARQLEKPVENFNGWLKISLTDKEKEKIEKVSSSLIDPGVQEKFKNFLVKELKYQKWRKNA